VRQEGDRRHLNAPAVVLNPLGGSFVFVHGSRFAASTLNCMEAAPLMNPHKKFHLVFSLLMGAMMIFLMTFVITLVNVGLTQDFVFTWAKAFAIAYVVGVPVIFFLAPVARKLTSRFVPPPGA
jgi:predicted membrane channel-forming protein YqfA (hemolysin III family)